MTDLAVAAPLAAALDAKGFAQLTPVQEAVLAPEAKGRDALVSARTGSGKTVAFGLAIATQILGEADRARPVPAPLALVVAPTRELALQVARELAWLYDGAGASVATCVGGMDQRAERRALERGPHLVVGTPGRLRDHIERGHLDLGGVKACVLDEADEMLDLGFREDLEFILRAAPGDRRTLMFSATVPRAIEDLARTFQRDALRIATPGEASQHADIEHRALSVAARDRENAIFNLLRFHDARAALVFCRTRAAVSHLHARMGNRGFPVVALSGELSQAERTHALQALRDGRARVCIATDVAARGIDLPGLDLVVHADLPADPATLLHRSGRTGRAGAKGVSALIVAPAEARKAQRLLQGAGVVAAWGRAPSAQEVRDRDDARLLEHPALAGAPGEEAPLAAGLLARFGPDRVAAAFVRLWRDARPAPEELADVPVPAGPPAGPAAPPVRRDRAAFGDAVWFALPVGRTGRAEARWLLPKVCEAGGITKDAVGAIRVQADETFVQVARAEAHRFAEGVEVVPGLAMRRLPGEPALERPDGAARAARAADRRPPGARRPRDDARSRPAPSAGPGPQDAAGKRPATSGGPFAKRERPKPPTATSRVGGQRVASPGKPRG